jgi:hypothetical protein
LIGPKSQSFLDLSSKPVTPVVYLFQETSIMELSNLGKLSDGNQMTSQALIGLENQYGAHKLSAKLSTYFFHAQFFMA